MLKCRKSWKPTTTSLQRYIFAAPVSCQTSDRHHIPNSRHTKDRKTPTLHIDEQGVCDACRFAEKKDQIDWQTREKELERLLDRFRRNDGEYDCILPGSGGKDSIYASHVLKYKSRHAPPYYYLASHPLHGCRIGIIFVTGSKWGASITSPSSPTAG